MDQYFDLDHPEWRWFTDRRFGQPSQFRRYAQAAGLTWNRAWTSYGKMPRTAAAIIRAKAKEHEGRCVKRKATPKHVYLYIEGRSRFETKYLRRRFRELHPLCQACGASFATTAVKKMHLCSRCRVQKRERLESPPRRLGLPYPQQRTPPPQSPIVLMPAGIAQAVVLDRDDAARFPFAGARNNGGYVVARKDRDCRPLHRQLVNAKLGDYFSFRNGDRRDNRRENIVPTTPAEIARRRPTRSRTGYRGVSLEKNGYVARITHQRRKWTLERFATPVEAARCYDAFARWLGGESAPVNFPAVRDPSQYASAYQRLTAARRTAAVA